MVVDEESRYRLRMKLVPVLGSEETATLMTLLSRWDKLKSDFWFGLKLAGIFAAYVTWLFVIGSALAD